MQHIDINTTQNVTIQYEVAQFRDRFFAFLIDQAIIYISLTILNIMFVFASDGMAIQYFLFLFTIPVFLFFTLTMELLMNGQTPGKRAMEIKVVKTSGKQPQVNDYLMRWVFRAVDIWLSLGVLAAIFIRSTTNGQRLGDLMSDTTLVRIRPDKRLKIDDLSKIRSQSNYSPNYLEAQKLSEETLILVKEALERLKKYRNDAHENVVHVLADKLENALGIKREEDRPEEFLFTLLRDYVSLTR